MRKEDRAQLFRTRLAEALGTSAITQAELADRSGVDRSTVSALLTASVPRLPNGHLVAEMASVLAVTTDWLLGLSSTRHSVSEILSRSMEVKAASRGPGDRQIDLWRAEALGAKLRNVPTSLPDLVKTDAVIELEYAGVKEHGPAQAQQVSESVLEISRSPESDLEYCVSMQLLSALARREGIWSGLTARQVEEQLERLTELHEELYPRLRIYLYDALKNYSAPITIFGARRAIVFLGESYFSFTTREHILALTRQFDQLIRDASVEAHALPEHVATLRRCP